MAKRTINKLTEKLDEVTLENEAARTPYSLRKRSSSGAVPKYAVNNDSDKDEYRDFSDSGSEFEYVSSDSDSESQAEEESSKGEDEEESSEEESGKEDALKPSRITSDKAYVIKSDDYFTSGGQKRALVSKNSFDKLKTPNLQHDEILRLVCKSVKISRHKKNLEALAEANRGSFARWLYLMHEGFSILLHGFGSKMKVLKDFQDKYLRNVPVVVVNGFFPSLSIKAVLDTILLDILELKESPASLHDACDRVAQEMSHYLDMHVYLLIHNIEGEMLKNSKAQGALSRLAAIKNLHVVASIDHVNAPLIWDNVKLSKFNFVWFDVTSFLPYIDETAFESSVMLERTKDLALSSLSNVFMSLTSNSKGIYLLIVKYQLENGGGQQYQGYLFKDLYWACREAFLVSSNLALRSQLTEFVDHKMLKFRRSADGSEYLLVPTAKNILQQFYEQQSK